MVNHKKYFNFARYGCDLKNQPHNIIVTLFEQMLNLNSRFPDARTGQ
jgi:hypothetical protein